MAGASCVGTTETRTQTGDDGQVLTALLALGAGAAAAGTVVLSAHAASTRRLWWLAGLLAAVAAAAVRASGAPVPVGSALAGAGLVAAAVVDGAEGRIPTAVAHGTAAVAGITLVTYSVRADEPGVALRAAVLTAVLVAACAALWLAGAMGFGDVRLAVGTATAMLGGAPALVLLVWCGAVAAGFMALRRRLVVRARWGRGDAGFPRPVPFGPALAAAWLIAVVAV
jgi:leader peptidase (prepilin peptidase)/N-methyltransferase